MCQALCCQGVLVKTGPASSYPCPCPQNGADEDIWNAAQSVIEDAKLNPFFAGGTDNVFGAAINPTNRRGQHQVCARVLRGGACTPLAVC